jgi:hypothetical protein
VERAVPTLCGQDVSRVAAGNQPSDLVSSFLFSGYIQILANSKKNYRIHLNSENYETNFVG